MNHRPAKEAMMRAFRLFTALALIVGLLAACGNDDDSAPPNDDATPAADNGDDPGDDPGDGPTDDPGETDTENGGASASADAGTFTVDGVTYGIHEAMQCDPSDFDVDMVELLLDTQYLGRSDEGGVIVHISHSEFAGNPSWDVSYNGPEGVFGAHLSDVGGQWMGEQDDTYAEAPVTVEGNNITGAATLYDPMTMEESVEVSFAVTFPDQLISC